MAGPKAPKDPERKRPYFYIMKDKDIYGSVQEDGSIIHFIYESDGRLINSAQIAGNIENKEELGLLETVEGFGRLVPVSYTHLDVYKRQMYDRENVSRINYCFIP